MPKLNKWSESYVDQFLRLRCASDVLNCAGTLNAASKEISEAMAIITRIRGYVLAHKMECGLLDLCAGNSLVSVLAIHLLPLAHAWSVDIKPRLRNVPQRFTVVEADISAPWFTAATEIAAASLPLIIVSSHPCRDLARTVIGTYLAMSQARMLVMLPCCVGKRTGKLTGRQRWVEKFGRYEAWAYELACLAGGDYVMDQRCLSPCRAVVTAQKREDGSPQ